MSILDTIVAYKKDELKDTKAQVPLVDLKARLADVQTPRDFVAALRKESLQVIAEVKPASPSKGVLRSPCNPVQIAQTYAQNGAAAISVLTERRFFGASLENLIAIRRSVDLPLLRKDFIFDPYQVYEAKAAGADAVLLMAAILSDAQLQDLYSLACELKLAVLPEVHNLKELDRVLKINPPLIGINNRNFESMQTDISTTFNLFADIPKDKVVVSESGIKNKEQLRQLAQAGIGAVLVGEILMQAPDISARLKELLSYNQ